MADPGSLKKEYPPLNEQIPVLGEVGADGHAEEDPPLNEQIPVLGEVGADGHAQEDPPLNDQIPVVGEVGADGHAGPLQHVQNLGAAHANGQEGNQPNQVILDLGNVLMGEEVAPHANAENDQQFIQIFQNLEHALMGPVEVHAQAEGQVFDLGVHHLRNLNEPRLRNVINENLQLPVFDVNDGNMTVFARLSKALIEEGGRNRNRATIYGHLVTECNGDVNPVTVAGLGLDVLVDLGVGGRLKAEAIVHFAESFQDQNEADQLPQLQSAAIFQRLKVIPGVGGYRALYMLVFGMRRLDYMPPELTLRQKLDRLYGNQKPDYETWNPYKGLASWFIWKYVSKW